MTNQNNDEIVVVVSPRSVGDVSTFEATGAITAENVKDFQSDDATVANATRELENRGFRVLDASPVSISIAGTRENLQEVLGVKVKKQTLEVMEGQRAEFFTATKGVAEKLLEPPEAMADLIEGIAIPQPPELFQSPLPPIAPPPVYRYLYVPDDVGLVLKAVRVHRMGGTGKDIKVAMVDTGFYKHPFYNRHGFVVRNTILGPGAYDPTKDTISHGTGEAANVFSTAPGVELIPVKDMFSLDQANSDIVGAFNRAVKEKPHVITNSWGFDVDSQTWIQLKIADPGLWAYLKLLEKSVAFAVASGIVVCFSAGNQGKLGFPASHPDVIAVGGVHVNYPDLDLEASNYASSFDSLLYPGRHVPDLCGLCGKDTAESIMLPVEPKGWLDRANTGSTKDGWGIFSGTSAACPQVAGVAALILEKDPSMTPAHVKGRLIKTAMDVKKGTSATGDVAGNGVDDATGAGLVDAKWAWVLTMGDVAAQFFEASTEVRAEMLERGQVPQVPREFIADLMDTIRTE